MSMMMVRLTSLVLFLFVSAALSFGESRLLTDDQLDGVTAGMGESSTASTTGNTGSGQQGGQGINSVNGADTGVTSGGQSGSQSSSEVGNGPAFGGGPSDPVNTQGNQQGGEAPAPGSTEGSEAPVDTEPTDLPSPPTLGNHETVVGDSSTARLHTRATVLLSGGAQQGGRALNLVNSSLSDVVGGVNIWDGRDFGSLGLAQNLNGFQVNQINSITQVGNRTAKVGNLTLFEPNISEFSRTTSSSSGFNSNSVTHSVISRSFSNRSVDIHDSAVVPTFNPFNSVISLGSIQPNPFQIPSFTFDVDFTVGSEPSKFGVAVSGTVGPFTFTPPGVDFGSIDLRDDFITLRPGSINLPALSGSISGSEEVCAFVCHSESGSGTFSIGEESYPFRSTRSLSGPTPLSPDFRFKTPKLTLY